LDSLPYIDEIDCDEKATSLCLKNAPKRNKLNSERLLSNEEFIVGQSKTKTHQIEYSIDELLSQEMSALESHGSVNLANRSKK
jgi:hypothetical protein